MIVKPKQTFLYYGIKLTSDNSYKVLNESKDAYKIEIIDNTLSRYLFWIEKKFFIKEEEGLEEINNW